MVTTEMRDLDVQFGKEYVRSTRSAHDLVERITGKDLIDFRMAPNTPEWMPARPFRSKRDAQNEFERLAGDIRQDSPDGVYLAAGADSKVAYLSFSRNSQEYLQPSKVNNLVSIMARIMGYNPRLIPWPEVNSARHIVARQFHDLYELSFDRSGWQKFIARYGITPTEATRHARMHNVAVISEIVKEVGVRSQPRVNVVEVSELTNWIGWVRANREEGCEYRVNRNSINREKFFGAVPIRRDYHEGDHAVQAQSISDNIDDGNLNPGLGDTTIPGPEQTMLEALASRITKLHPGALNIFPEEQRAHIDFAVNLQYLSDITYTNAQYRLLILRQPRGTVLDDLMEFLVFEPRNRMELMLTSLTSQPENMFYLTGYGVGSYFIKANVESLPEERRREFSVKAHNRPMTLQQAEGLVRELTAS